MIRRLGVIFALSGTAFALAHCTDDDDSSARAGLDASMLDAATSDAGASKDGSASVDAGGADAEAADAAVIDAGTGDAADGASDAGPEIDAAPGFDDAGCPLFGGTVLSAADAGLPATGLALWLRADVALATLDGGAVCRWDDVSGNGRSFVPAAAPPVRSATGLKGGVAVSFPASGTHLVRNDVLGLAATSARTVVVFGATQDTTHRFQYFFQGEGGTAGTYFGLDQNTFNTTGSHEGAYVTNNGYDANVATSTNPRTHVLSISSFAAGTALPAALVYAIDGTPVTLTRTPGGLGSGTVESFANADFTTIGAGASGFTGAMLGEMLVYDHALTGPERAAVEQYLSQRFP
jgi:hypothetical protein